MKRTYSLKRNKEFQRVYRAGKSCGARGVVMIHTRAYKDSLRVGFSVSKKLGNAVSRNRIKRRLREAFSILLPQVKRGCNIIFVAKEPIKAMAFSDICNTLLYLLKKAELWDG